MKIVQPDLIYLEKYLQGLLFVIMLIALPINLISQNQKLIQDFVPIEGAEGKDVIWLPTHQLVSDAMLDMAEVGPKDIFLTSVQETVD